MMSCTKSTQNSQPEFNEQPLVTKLIGRVPEVSGIAAATTNGSNLLWLIEDSGNPARMALVNKNSELVKYVDVPGSVNRDWEDIISILHQDRSPLKREIYIGDIGNNDAASIDAVIYHFDEPETGAYLIGQVQAIHFSYDDGPRDAEAFLVDQKTRDIFIITKRDSRSRIYRITYPYQTQNTAKFAGELPYTGVVSASAGAGDMEFLVKTYQKVYHYRRNGNESIPTCLLGTSLPAPYQQELQGESICFAWDGSGYYTLSETPLGGDQSLYFYKRN